MITLERGEQDVRSWVHSTIGRRPPGNRSVPIWLLMCLLVVTAAVGLVIDRPASTPAPTSAVRVGVAVAAPPGAVPVGPVAPSRILDLELVFKTDAKALEAVVSAVSTPGSAEFHHYLSERQFASRFGATSSTKALAVRTLRSEGFTVGRSASDGLSVEVSAPVAVIERAFQLRLEEYRVPGGTLAYGSNLPPAVPVRLGPSLVGIVGLDSFGTPRAVGAAQSSRSTRRSGIAGACRGMENQSGVATQAAIARAAGFRALYRTGDRGQGETIGLYELEPFLRSDLSVFERCAKVSPAVEITKVDGGPQRRGVGSGEAIADIEILAGLAPGAAIDVFEGAPNDPSGPYDTLAAMVDDPTLQVVSDSWGVCEEFTGITEATAEEQLLAQAAVQGMSFFSAAGDTGSEDCESADPQATALAVDDPTNDPYVTSVGGTMYQGSLRGRQVVWNVPPLPGVPAAFAGGPSASGGGVWTFFEAPAWAPSEAAPTPTPFPQLSGTCVSGCRGVPDVSALAGGDVSYAVYYGGQWGAGGGTSLATPLWAAFAALADASAACQSSGPLGLINPALYSIAASPAYHRDFYDVTRGGNDLQRGGMLYEATTGYDTTSGLGSMKAGPLSAALCGSPRGPTADVAALATADAPVGNS